MVLHRSQTISFVAHRFLLKNSLPPGAMAPSTRLATAAVSKSKCYQKFSIAMTGLVIGSRYTALMIWKEVGLFFFFFPRPCGRGACTHMRECWLIRAAHPQYTMPVLSLASLSALLLEASSCSSLARLIRFLIRTRPHPL